MANAMLAPAPASVSHRALTTRPLDFWLLGGASLAVWLAMTAADSFRARPVVDERLAQAAVLALSLSLVANYPGARSC